MNEIATYRPPAAQVPRVMGQAAYLTIAAMKSAMQRDWRGNGKLPANAYPSDSARQKLSLRLSELDEALRPAGSDAVLPEIVSVLVTMANRAGDVADAVIVQKIYAADLADLPLFAVRMACADYRQKRVGDGKWAPTQGEIREVALKHAAVWRGERADIISILEAELAEPAPRASTEEERQAAIDRVRRVAADTAWRLKASVPKNEVGREIKEEPYDPVKDPDFSVRRTPDRQIERRDEIARVLTEALERKAAEYAASPIRLSGPLAAQSRAAVDAIDAA